MKRNALCWAIVCCLIPAWTQAADPGAAGKVVAIEVLLAEMDAATLGERPADDSKLAALIQELDRQDKLRSVTRVRLTTLENQPASIQYGERVATATGRVVGGAAGFGGNRGGGGGPGMATSYMRENVGTIVSVTARVLADGTILVDLTAEQSRVQTDRPTKGDAGVAEQDPELLSRPITKQVKSTLAIPSGQTVLVGGMRAKSANESRQDVVLVTAQVVFPK